MWWRRLSGLLYIRSSTFESSNASLATDCVCGPGFANGTERCEPCLAGQYKEELANASCVGCMPHATTLQSASANADQCVCLPGFTVASPADSAVNEECVMCGPGSYKSLAGDGECSVCPAQHYTDTKGRGRRIRQGYE